MQWETRPAKLMQYLSFWLFHNTLSICIYHEVGKTQSRVSLFLSSPICSPCRAISHSLTCQLCWGHSHLWICHIAICSLCLFCSQREQFLLAFCTSEGTREICLDSAYPCLVAPLCPLVSWPQVAISKEHFGTFACQLQSPSKFGREFFWWVSTCPALMYPSNCIMISTELWPTWEYL